MGRPTPLHDDAEGAPSVDVPTAEDAGPDRTEDTHQANRFMVARESSNTSPQLSQYYSGSLRSRDYAVSSGTQSAIVYHSNSVGTVSPRAWLLGVGSWDVHNEADRFPPEYHFLATPLRLSPQYEHCRGLPVSHMVVQDDLVLLNYVEGD